MPTSKPAEKKPDTGIFLLVIAIFKMVKSVMFIGLGIGLLHFLNTDVENRLQNLMDGLHVDSDNHLANWCLDEAGRLTNLKLASLSAICFFYAALFGTEGIGLYLRKRWAEYFVVIVTASLLPLEAYEVWYKITVLKILLTISNLIILGYLMWLIRQKKK